MAILVFVALQLADLLTTYIGLHYLGGTEVNPVMRWVLRYCGFTGLVATKIVTSALFIYVCRHSMNTGPEGVAHFALIIVNAIYIAIVLNNLLGILVALF